MAKRAKRLRVGPTGDFPRGKLNPADEGGLRVAVTHTGNGTIVIDFGARVAWIGLDVTTARALANCILQHAKEIES